MERMLSNRLQAAALRLGSVALGAFVLAAPLAAQQQPATEVGGRFRVLVPALEPQAGQRPDFGKKTADELRDLIDDMPTHAPVEEREVRTALRRFGVKENELDCIKSRQLAVQIGAELVMCGTYDGAQVTARFISAKTGEVFEVAPFASRDPEEAAQKVFGSFEQFVNQARETTFCVEYLASQQYQNALEACNRSLAINDQSVAALYAKARVLQGMGAAAEQANDTAGAAPHWQESFRLHQRVLEMNPAHTDALLTAGVVATELSQPEQAREYFRQYLELNPGNVDVRLKIASDLNTAGDPEGALQLVEAGLQQDTAANPTLLTFAGHFALTAGRRAGERAGSNGGMQPAERALYEKALGYYRRVFEVRGAESEADMLRNMVITYMLLGQPDQAVALGKQVVDTKPDNAALWVIYSDALKEAGRTQEAVAALDRATQIDPNLPDVAGKRALLLLAAGNLSGAGQAFRGAVSAGKLTGDQAADVVFVAGYDKMRAGQESAASDYFDLARELAQSSEKRARSNFFNGIIVFNRAVEAHKPQNLRSARASLPLFRRALELFQASGDYTEQSRAIQQYINNARQYISYEEELIKRGQ